MLKSGAVAGGYAAPTDGSGKYVTNCYKKLQLFVKKGGCSLKFHGREREETGPNRFLKNAWDFPGR